MLELTHILEHFLIELCDLLAVLVEIWVTILLIIVLLKEVVRIFKYKFIFSEIAEDPRFGRGLSSVIEIYMASELLKSITSTSVSSLLTVGLLVILRVFMTYALHWEGSHKKGNGLEVSFSGKEEIEEK